MKQGQRKYPIRNGVKYHSVRIVYDPEFDPALPFKTYWNGVASRHFETVSEAQRHLDPNGIENWSAWE